MPLGVGSGLRSPFGWTDVRLNGCSDGELPHGSPHRGLERVGRAAPRVLVYLLPGGGEDTACTTAFLDS